MAKVVFLHGEYLEEAYEKLIKDARINIKARWDKNDPVIIELYEEKEYKEKAVKTLNSICEPFVIVYDTKSFNGDYVYGFVDATEVSEDVRAIISLDELMEYNRFRFLTEF